MPKYKVEFSQTETYVIDVIAKDESQAIKKAEVKFNKAEADGLLHYLATGNGGREVRAVYDVTHTDDPFNP